MLRHAKPWRPTAFWRIQAYERPNFRGSELNTMNSDSFDRRNFIRGLAGTAAAVAPSSRPRSSQAAGAASAKIRFSVIALNHGHVNSQTSAPIRGGADLRGVYGKGR